VGGLFTSITVIRPDLRAQLKALAKDLATQRAAVELAERTQRMRAERARREANVFLDATRDVTPLPPSQRAAAQVRAGEVPTVLMPLMHQRDEAEALAASLSDGIDADSLLETDEDLSYLRDGVAPNTVKKLRRGDWAIQGHLDLHGLTRDEARDAVAQFLRDSTKCGWRCVRIVHGKGLGSRNRAPVLKIKLRRWLMQSEAVLAYVQARGADGGAGAVLVLLNAGQDG
jgi:DNA-nicking Smr family endonuclease